MTAFIVSLPFWCRLIEEKEIIFSVILFDPIATSVVQNSTINNIMSIHFKENILLSEFLATMYIILLTVRGSALLSFWRKGRKLLILQRAQAAI